MKGVIICGGLGSRLYPLTHATNKMLLPVYDKPMICYPIQNLIEAGIEDILFVLGGPFAGHVVSYLKDGRHLGIKHLQYAYQSELRGPGDALLYAEEFAAGGPVAVILGDQVTDASLKTAVSEFKSGATILTKKFTDPDGMGVVEFNPKDPTKIINIEENPKNPKTQYAATGIYLYDNKCFSFIKDFRDQVDGEIKPTHINNKYIELDELAWQNLDGFWTDAGKFDRLLEAGMYFSNKAHA